MRCQGARTNAAAAPGQPVEAPPDFVNAPDADFLYGKPAELL